MTDQTMIRRNNEDQTSPMAVLLRVLVMGMFFGMILVKSEVVRWERIHKMFLFQEAHMYLIIGTAVVVGAIGMYLIRRFQVKTMDGNPIVYKPKPYNKGVIFGGTLFGMGWAITGACPGPIYAQIGAGAWPALFTFIGAIGGMYLYAALQSRLPH